MTESLALVTLVVRDYDEAIRYFTSALGFALLEDSPRAGGKRWIRVAPKGSSGSSILLAKAASPEQDKAVGNQTGGRVGFFLHTSDFQTTSQRMRKEGVRFAEEPRFEPYGIVAVFVDLYGNRWDLIEPKKGPASASGQ